MKKLNLYLLSGIAYISFITGRLLGEVGNIPKCTNEPNNYWLPIGAVLVLGTMFILGWLASEDHYEK